ncbi:MAG TPA: disulfide bond formation protein DsbA, partial [Acidimicrobiaceae bacterium]|nr:disulfide bond formation protein DsbA [Acidimicrobiaceae bacterium]
MTARWVVDEVKDQRDLQITWQPFSLLLKNQPAEGTPYYDGVLRTYKMLRVMESVRATEGNDGVFALYWELGARIHHDKDREFDIADALVAAGLPAMHAEA